MDTQQSSWLAIHWKGVLGSLLSLVPIPWLIRCVMYKTHPISKLSERIVTDSVVTGQIYMHRKVLCSVTFRVKHFWYFKCEFEPTSFDISLSGMAPFNQKTANVNPAQLSKAQQGQVTIPESKLSDQEISYIQTVCHNPGWIDVLYVGKLRFKTWFGSYEHQVSVRARCSVS